MQITIITKKEREGGETLGRTLLIYLAAKSGRAVSPNGSLSQVYYDAAKELDRMEDGELLQFFDTYKEDGNITITTEK